MPMDRSQYSPDWDEISRNIRAKRAAGRCECVGHCGNNHMSTKEAYALFDLELGEFGRCPALNGQAHPVTGSKVVLTVAHLDHNPRNNELDNLLAMCQRCHLAYDADHHAQNAAKTRRQKQLDAGQQEMQFD